MLSRLYIDAVIAKCDVLKRSGLWAPEPQVRPLGWLNNFTGTDKVLGAIILDNFVYYSSRATDRLLIAAFQRLEDDLLTGQLPSRDDPRELLHNLIFTPIEGEDPRPTDSGNTMCRRARDLLGLPDERFFQPDAALLETVSGAPIVFVDDFLGMGFQFLETWKRERYGRSPTSFADAYTSNPFPVYCLVLVATDEGIQRVRSEVPHAVVVAAHRLDASYSIRALQAPRLVPPIDSFQDTMRDFLERFARRLNAPAHMKRADWLSFGFHSLGYLLAFEHGAPDCSLPILWADAPNPWVKLVTKR